MASQDRNGRPRSAVFLLPLNEPHLRGDRVFAWFVGIEAGGAGTRDALLRRGNPRCIFSAFLNSGNETALRRPLHVVYAGDTGLTSPSAIASVQRLRSSQVKSA